MLEFFCICYQLPLLIFVTLELSTPSLASSVQAQVKHLAAVDITEWKMSYDDMELKDQVGSGQFGVVVLAQLNREATSPTVTQYIQKQETPEGFPPSLLVAVKRYDSECGLKAAIVLMFHMPLYW